MWDDLINENTLITFLVGMYFWGWFLFLRSKFSKKNNWFHVIFFLIFFFVWILDADWSWLIEPQSKN